ncbi:MAG: S9 family peptidase [Bacteroidales bacterium]|nr:S9 family peptidase [Bacteroidales bacterium]
MKLISRTGLFLFILSFIFNAAAQDKMLTLEDATWMNSDLRPQSLRGLQWRGESESFTWIANNSLVSGNVKNETSDTLLTLKALNSVLSLKEFDELKRFPAITWVSNDKFMFTHNDTLFSYEVNSKELKKTNEYPEKAKNTDIDENRFSIAYTIENNLFVAMNSEQIAVTNDEDAGIVNGQSVHRSEFGIYKGTFWSPEGNFLAFYRMDETMVTDYPLVDIDTRIAEVKNTKYPMAGMTSHEVTIGVYNPKTNEKIFLKTGEPADQYLTTVTWGPDEKQIFVGVLNRDQNHLKLNKYDASTGEFIQTLFEEKDEEYVEPEHNLYFLNSNPDQFLWFSERDGYNHLYLYDIDGNLIKQVTKGAWVVTSFLGTDQNDKKLFYVSTEESPIEKQIYSLEMKSGKTTRLSSVKGTHRAILNSDAGYFIDIYSSQSEDITKEYALIDTKGNTKRILLENVDPLKEYNLGETSIFTIKNPEGTDLYCRMIKPPGFDQTKKYPVFLYVYGGPHSQLVSNSWLGGGGLFLNYMAQQGFIVFTLDNRGTGNRGIDFEQAIFRNMGSVEVEDQIAGINYLKTLNFVDPDRIGVNGWSYGGFMTISLMLQHPDVFKAGACGGPVTDWKYYEVMYGERYMDTPEANPEGYEQASLLDKAENLEGKLLIIHGTEDPTVVWQQSLQFIKSCIEAGKQVDHFVYPGHGHGVRGKDRLHLNTKMATYFLNNL